MLEVICGCMFSGKTEELIRRLRRAKIANKTVQVFKPTIDNRYNVNTITSHSSQEFPAINVNHEFPQDVLKLATADVIGIEEAQFFSSGIVRVVRELMNSGKRVIVAGLDLDAFENSFGPMPELMALAENITKLSAVCVSCGDSATRSYRKEKSSSIIEVGGLDEYEARCRKCFLHGNLRNN
jgi:thymidine kinase